MAKPGAGSPKNYEEFESDSLPEDADDDTADLEEDLDKYSDEIDIEDDYIELDEEEEEDESKKGAKTSKNTDKPGQEEEEFVEVTYNKQKIKVSKADMPTLIQKGMNYDKVHGRLSETDTKLAALQEESGMSLDDIIDSVKRQNMTVAVQKMLDENPDMTEAEAERKIKQERLQKQKNLQTEKAAQDAQNKLDKIEYSKKPYFKELEADIDKFMLDNPGVSVSTAYFYLRGMKADELEKSNNDKTEKRTIANIQDRMKRGGVDSKDRGASNSEYQLSPTQLKLAKEFGLDPKEVAKRNRKR